MLFGGNSIAAWQGDEAHLVASPYLLSSVPTVLVSLSVGLLLLLFSSNIHTHISQSFL